MSANRFFVADMQSAAPPPPSSFSSPAPRQRVFFRGLPSLARKKVLIVIESLLLLQNWPYSIFE